MKVTLVLVTGSDSSPKDFANFTNYAIGLTRFSVTRSFVEVPKLGVGDVNVDLLWVRPSGAKKNKKDPLPLLNPQMELSSRGSGQYDFSFRVRDWPALRFDSAISHDDALVVVIRHWVRRLNSDSHLTGLDWHVKWGGYELQAKRYLREQSPDFVFNTRPYIFLAGLRAQLEESLVTSSELGLRWLLNDALAKYSQEPIDAIAALDDKPASTMSPGQSLLPSLGERRSNYTEAQPRNEIRGRSPSVKTEASEVIPLQPQDITDEDSRFVAWIYSGKGREADSARLAAELPGSGSSRFLVVPWNKQKQESWKQCEDCVEIAEAIRVQKGDIVLAHGFDDREDLRRALKETGVVVMDYSPSDESWQRSVEDPLRRCKNVAEVRKVLIAYVLQTDRRPVDLLHRVLHRAVNRLAPLRIDVAVIGELARDRNHLEISDQLFEMREAWKEQPQSLPLCCVGNFYSMLVGRVAKMPASPFRPDLSIPFLSTDDILCEQFCNGSSSGRACQLLDRLIELSGLQENGGVYTPKDASAVLQYTCGLENALFRADTREKTLELAGNLVRSVRQERSDIVAIWLGLSGFSYAAWLEEVSSLLVMLLEVAENVEERAESEDR